MIRRRLPPLNPMRAFEAAARHLSFTRAAEELLISQSAVSHQVKVLEGCLGCQLFDRSGVVISLTTDGETLLEVCSKAFDLIASGARDIGTPRNSAISICATPYMSSHWLVPNLRFLREEFPDQSFTLTHAQHPFKNGRDQSDIAIGWASKGDIDSDAQILMQVSFVPVCSRAWLNEGVDLRNPHAIARSLLHEADHLGWEQWLETAGVERVDVRSGVVFDDVNVMFEAVKNGQGIALAPLPLAERALDDDNLIRMSSISSKSESAYYIKAKSSKANSGAIAKISDFLMERAGCSQVPAKGGAVSSPASRFREGARSDCPAIDTNKGLSSLDELQVLLSPPFGTHSLSKTG